MSSMPFAGAPAGPGSWQGCCRAAEPGTRGVSDPAGRNMTTASGHPGTTHRIPRTLPAPSHRRHSSLGAALPGSGRSCPDRSGGAALTEQQSRVHAVEEHSADHRPGQGAQGPAHEDVVDVADVLADIGGQVGEGGTQYRDAQPLRGRVRGHLAVPGKGPQRSPQPRAALARSFTHQPQEGGAEHPADAPAQRGPVRASPAAPAAARRPRLRLGLLRLDEADAQLPIIGHGSRRRLRGPLRARGARLRPAHGAGRSGRRIGTSGGIGLGGRRRRLLRRRGLLLGTGLGAGERHSRDSGHSTPIQACATVPEELPL